MRRSTILAASMLTCLLAISVADAIILPYGHREITAAGVGCAGGQTSEHGNVAYYVGDTDSLNKRLAMLEADSKSKHPATVVLHAGAKTIDPFEEEPLTGLGDQSRRQMSIAWSVNKACPFDRVAMGDCKCEERNVTVHIWIANQIRLRDLIIPTEFVVRSAGEIEDFVKRHTERQ